MGDDESRVLFFKRKTRERGAEYIDRQKSEKYVKPSGLIEYFLSERCSIMRFKSGGHDQDERHRADQYQGEFKRAENFYNGHE